MKCECRLLINDIEVGTISEVDIITDNFGIFETFSLSMPINASGEEEFTLTNGIDIYNYIENCYRIENLVNFCNTGRFLD